MPFPSTPDHCPHRAGVFGPDRHAFLQHGLAAQPKHHDAEALRVATLTDQIADLTARQDRLIEELETADGAFRDRLRRRFETLEADRTTRLAQLHDFQTASATAEPEQDAALLDAVPILEHLDITTAPEATQRKLYDALQLTIHYDRPDQARFRLVLTDDTAVGQHRFPRWVTVAFGVGKIRQTWAVQSSTRPRRGAPQRLDGLRVHRDLRSELVQDAVVAQFQVERVEQPPPVLLREFEQVELMTRRGEPQQRTAARTTNPELKPFTLGGLGLVAKPTSELAVA